MTGVVLEVTDATYHEEILNNRGLILVAFMTEGDSSCRALRPILADLARERAGRCAGGAGAGPAPEALTHLGGLSMISQFAHHPVLVSAVLMTLIGGSAAMSLYAWMRSHFRHL